MKRLIRKVAVVGALLAIVGAPLAYAAGLWFGLPVVGGGTYCSGSTTAGPPGTAAVCNTTVPAGPTTMTGQELIPADLNPQGTQAAYPGPGTGTSGVQTGYEPLANVASGAYQLAGVLTPSVTFSPSIANGITNLIVNATGTQTYVGFLLPVTPTDGQIVRITSNVTLTNFAVTSGLGSTATVDTPTKVLSPFVPLPSTTLPTTSVTVGGISYLYNLSNNRWFRLQ